MKSRLLAGIAAVVLAIIGAILVVSYAQGADTRAVQGLDPVSVLVVKKAVPAGTSVAGVESLCGERGTSRQGRHQFCAEEPRRFG